MTRHILHIDMDAFFASVEELCNPSLKGRPVAVAGAGVRTVITTSSYAARKWGVRTGMTVGQGIRLCPELLILKADHRKYTHASKKILEVLESFTPAVEPFSVDEAFIDAAGVLMLHGSPADLARKIKDRILTVVGLTCSVGVAPNRLLAKLASGLEKPDGLTVLKTREVPALLDRMPVKKICGIGPKTVKELEALGIETCGQLGRYPSEILTTRFGILGRVLQKMGRGEDVLPAASMLSGNHDVKSVGHSVTLGHDITDRLAMERILLTLSEMVGRRARRHFCCGRKLTLTVRYGDFTTFSRQKTFAAPIWTTGRIYDAACLILSGLSLEKPVRLLGLSLGSLEFGQHQNSLIYSDRAKESLQGALDTINDRYGEFCVSYADSVRDLRNHKVISPAWRQRGIRSTSTS